MNSNNTSSSDPDPKKPEDGRISVKGKFRTITYTGNESDVSYSEHEPEEQVASDENTSFNEEPEVRDSPSASCSKSLVGPRSDGCRKKRGQHDTKAQLHTYSNSTSEGVVNNYRQRSIRFRSRVRIGSRIHISADSSASSSISVPLRTHSRERRGSIQSSPSGNGTILNPATCTQCISRLCNF